MLASSRLTPPTASDPSLLQVVCRATSDEMVIAVSGELDAASAHLLVDVLAAAGVAGCRRVVIDAAEVSFVDAAGLRTITTARGQHPRMQWRIANASRPMRRILELTGNEDLLQGRRALAGSSPSGGEGGATSPLWPTSGPRALTQPRRPR